MNEKATQEIIELNKILIEKGEYAGLGRRIWGHVLDVFIVTIVGVPFFLMLKFFLPGHDLVMDYCATILIWIYLIFCMQSTKQATLGSYFAGVRFAKVDASPITVVIAVKIIVATAVVAQVSIFLNKLIFGIVEPSLSGILEIIAIRSAIYVLPYFCTKRKQMLVDLMLGVVALKDTEIGDTQEKLSSYTNEVGCYKTTKYLASAVTQSVAKNESIDVK